MEFEEVLSGTPTVTIGGTILSGELMMSMFFLQAPMYRSTLVITTPVIT